MSSAYVHTWYVDRLNCIAGIAILCCGICIRTAGMTRYFVGRGRPRGSSLPRPSRCRCFLPTAAGGAAAATAAAAKNKYASADSTLMSVKELPTLKHTGRHVSLQRCWRVKTRHSTTIFRLLLLLLLLLLERKVGATAVLHGTGRKPLLIGDRFSNFSTAANLSPFCFLLFPENVSSTRGTKQSQKKTKTPNDHNTFFNIDPKHGNSDKTAYLQ